MARVDDGHVQSAPLVDADAVADRLRGHREHGWVVADEDDSASRRHRGFDHTYDVGDGEAREERPHSEVLEASGRRRELIAECVIFHIDPDEVVESGGGEAEDARDFLGVEEVGGFVPVDPHPSQIISQ